MGSRVLGGGAAAAERRTELLLRALAVGVLVVIAGIAITVFSKAWPSFSHNGLAWFGSGGDVDTQFTAMIQGPRDPANYVYHFKAWSLIWGTILTSGLAVIFGMAISILAAVFVVELAPARIKRAIDPVIRLLAGVPSVVYGLIGILAIAPWVEHNLISQQRKRSVEYVVQLTGANLTVATLILTVMIVPIIVAIVASALESVPRSWTEGSAALGSTAGARLGACRCALCDPRLSRPPCSPPRARWARRSCSRWSPARAAGRPTRSTGSRSSSSR